MFSPNLDWQTTNGSYSNISGRILNVERPDIEVGNFVVESALVGPLFCSRNQRIIASVHLYKKTPDFEEKTFVIRDNVNENDDDVDDKSSNCVEQKSRSSVFSLEEEILFGHLLDFAGRSLTSVQANQEMRLELSRSEVFLELARTVFREPSRLEPTMLTILMNFLSLIDCERCQVLNLVKKSTFNYCSVLLYKFLIHGALDWTSQ